MGELAEQNHTVNNQGLNMPESDPSWQSISQPDYPLGCAAENIS